MQRILLLVMLVMFVFKAQAQDQNPTTEEEYNYASAGYKLQLQMKLPMKKGYSAAELLVFEEGDRKCTFKAVIRTGEKLPCAVIMIYDRPRENPEYFCIPSSDASTELWDKFYSSLKSDVENEKDRFKFFSHAIAKALMTSN